MDIRSIYVRILLLHNIRAWTFKLACIQFGKSIATFECSQHNSITLSLLLRKPLFPRFKFETLVKEDFLFCFFFPMLVFGFAFWVSCRSFWIAKLLLSHRRNCQYLFSAMIAMLINCQRWYNRDCLNFLSAEEETDYPDQICSITCFCNKFTPHFKTRFY